MPKNSDIKTYVLDTNVLIHSPYSLYSFDEHTIVLCDAVIEELDNHKDDRDECGLNARESGKLLADILHLGTLSKGIRLPETGGILRVETNHEDIQLPPSWSIKKADNRILRVCKGMQEEGQNPILVTNDGFLRVKANTLGIPVEEYRTEQVSKAEDQYKGQRTLYVMPKLIQQFYKDKLLPSDALLEEMVDFPDDKTANNRDAFTVNEFVIVKDATMQTGGFLGRCNDRGIIVPLKYDKESPYGVHPRNATQRFLQECLMASVEEDGASLVIVKGPAGTSKTFYSLAVGLEQILNQSNYSKLFVTRPNIKFDEEIGYIKGTEQEKVDPLMRPIWDNLEELSKINDEFFDGGSLSEYLLQEGLLVTQAMAYMRGRSIPDQWILIDEAQNMTPRQAFGVTSRAGKGSKFILAGDPDQIDNPRLDPRTNGLSYASERMKGSDQCWQVTFNEDECERSRLAMEAIKRMSPKGYFARR